MSGTASAPIAIKEISHDWLREWPSLLYQRHRRKLVDQFKNNSHANSYVADNLSDRFALADLAGMNSWQRMDAKIAAIGGAAAMYQIESKVDLEQQT